MIRDTLGPFGKKVRRFFEKAPPQTSINRGNIKGRGFHIYKSPASPDSAEKEFKFYSLIGGALAVGGAAILLLAVAQTATPAFSVMVTVMAVLCGLIIYDILSRRVWETRLRRRVEELVTNHDRLVREVARNRSDIAILKEGLGDMALSVEAQGRKMVPSLSAEAKMIETIVSQLGALGDRPRPEVETRYDQDVLQLEMTPPPARPAPISDLDGALAPDFSQYSDTVVAELVDHAIRNDKFDIFIQPVVSLPQRKTRMLEVFARIRAGGGVYLPAARYLDLAEKQQLVPAIDNLLLLRCLQMLRARRETGERGLAYVLNISGRSLNDRGFMNDLVAFLTQNHKMATRLIFELPQQELLTQADTLAPVLDGLSKLGCRFSMDRVRNRMIDINGLKRCHIRFIKLDAQWILAEGGSKTGFSRVARLKKQLDAAGIDLIIERIETEQALRELLDFNIDYGQGYLFGKPDHHAAYRETQTAA